MTEPVDFRPTLPQVASVDPRRLLATRQFRFAVAALLIIAVILIVWSVLFDRPPPPPAPLPPDAFRPTAEQRAQLRIEPVRFGTNAELLRATGSIQADADHSTPILLPFSGQVLAVMAEQGDHVAAGQPLLRIASPELVDARNALLTASAQRTTAAKTEQLAEDNAKRQQEIYKTAGGALKDNLQAQSDLVTAQSNLRTAEAALQTARDRLKLFGKTSRETEALAASGKKSDGRASTVYRAPVSGIVADRSVAPGQFLSAGGSTPLLTITDPAHVWLVAQLPESEADEIHLGDRVNVTTPALPGRSFAAEIDNIGAGLDPVTHRLPVRATVANPDGALKPQMFAAFVITRDLAAGAGVVVPARAVIHEGDTARVWVLTPDGLLHGREVVAGDTEGGFTRILQGLRLGDRVVTSGALFVNEAGLNQ